MPDKQRLMLYVLRTFDSQGNRVWVLFNGEKALWGEPGETRRDLLHRWNYIGGTDKINVRYSGVMRPSEAVMTISGEKMKLQKLNEARRLKQEIQGELR